MDIETIKTRIERIRIYADKGYDETCNSLEDELWYEVMKSIADGSCETPILCAKECLKSLDVDNFNRGCR